MRAAYKCHERVLIGLFDLLLLLAGHRSPSRHAHSGVVFHTGHPANGCTCGVWRCGAGDFDVGEGARVEVSAGRRA